MAAVEKSINGIHTDDELKSIGNERNFLEKGGLFIFDRFF